MEISTTRLDYLDSSVASGETYTYTVRAVDAVGNVSPAGEPAVITVGSKNGGGNNGGGGKGAGNGKK